MTYANFRKFNTIYYSFIYASRYLDMLIQMSIIQHIGEKWNVVKFHNLPVLQGNVISFVKLNTLLNINLSLQISGVTWSEV